jgi:hypothetical protein
MSVVEHDIVEALKHSEVVNIQAAKDRALEVASGKKKLSPEKDMPMLRAAGVTPEQFATMVNIAKQKPAKETAARTYLKNESAYTAKVAERVAYEEESKRIAKEREAGLRALRGECGRLHELIRESRDAMAWLEKYFPDDEIHRLHSQRKDVVAKIRQQESIRDQKKLELHHIDQSLVRGTHFSSGGNLSPSDVTSMKERRVVLCDEIQKCHAAIEDLHKQHADIDKAIELHLCGGESQDSEI